MFYSFYFIASWLKRKQKPKFAFDTFSLIVKWILINIYCFVSLYMYNYSKQVEKNELEKLLSFLLWQSRCTVKCFVGFYTSDYKMNVLVHFTYFDCSTQHPNTAPNGRKDRWERCQTCVFEQDFDGGNRKRQGPIIRIQWSNESKNASLVLIIILHCGTWYVQCTMY